MGHDPQRLRAFAFSTGGLDSVMQLGVAHALLVARGRAPDYVVGVSSGAVNAAALAEILRAGETLDKATSRDRLAVKTDRLREFMNAYVEIPRTIIDSSIPDSLEVINNRPLKPLDSPLHFREEREMRETANDAKAGLIRLINDIFRIRLPFSAATAVVRRVLGCIQAGELPTWRGRVTEQLTNEAGLIGTAWHRLQHHAPAVCRIAWAALWSDNLIRFRRRRRRGTTAGKLVARWRRFGRLKAAVKVALQIVLVTPLLALVTATWALLWAPIIVPLYRIRRSKSLDGRAPTLDFMDRVLAFYGVRDGIGATDMIKTHLVHTFDPNYYGPAPISSVLQRALDYSADTNPTLHETRKRLFHYALPTHAKQELSKDIKVGIVAANVATGELELLPPQVPVVDALSAALSVVPFLPPTGIDPKLEATRAATSDIIFDGTDNSEPGVRWYIDGRNVSAQAIGPLIGFVRKDLEDKGADQTPAALDVYTVNTLPISRNEWRTEENGDGVIHNTRRALQLEKLRDATLDRRMTDLYSAALPAGKAAYCIDGVTYVRASIYGIDLDKPPDIAKHLFSRKPDDLREAIHATVAKGCLAALEQMVPASFKELATALLNDTQVEAHPLERPDPKQITGEVAGGSLAVSDSSAVQGESRSFVRQREIAHCELLSSRDREAPRHQRFEADGEAAWRFGSGQ